MLARVELNEGLTLPQLLSLGNRYLPRNATVIVFLPVVTPEVADGPHSAILRQVTNGLAVRMAVLKLVCGESSP